MANRFGSRVGFVAIVSSLMLGGCVRRSEPVGTDDPAKHAAAFRKARGLHDLQALLPALRLGLPRTQVEEILGKPDYCPTDDQCYYASDSRNAVGVPYGLVVDYRALNPFANKPDPPPGKLESFSLMAIAE